MSAEADLGPYFQESASWDADRVAQSVRSTRIAWTVAALALVAALTACAAVMWLSPLKRVEPFVIRVDNTTGLVDIVPIYTGTAALPEAVTRYLLTHYVEVCERFAWSTAERDYQECGAFHGAARNQAWSALWALSNPASPLNLHKDGSEVTAQVLAVSFFDRANGVRDLAQIRYTRAQHAAEDAAEQVTHWLATVQFAYGKPSTNVVLRQFNPLGLRVLSFKTEQEAVAEKAPVSAVARAPTGGTP